MRGTDRAAIAAAALVLVATAWGGAFAPTPRLVVTAALAVIVGWAAATWRDHLTTAEWLGLGVLGWAVVSAVVAKRYPMGAKETVTTWLAAWAILVLARHSGRKARGAAFALVAAGAGLTAAWVLGANLAAGALGLGGMYRNPNVAIALVIPALAVPWSDVGRSLGRWRWLPALLATAAIAATGSRAGLLALVAAAAVAFPRGRLRWLGLAGTAAGAAAIATWRFLSHPDALAWYRPAIWRAVGSLTAAHPVLGVGPGWLEDATGVVRLARPEAIAIHQHVIGSAESTVLGLAVRTGIVGAALAAAAIFLGYWQLRRQGLEQRRAGVVALAALAVMALFHDFLDQGVVLWTWALLVGSLLPATGQIQAESARRWPARPGVRLAAGLAVMWLLLWGAAEPAYARRLWWEGTSSTDLARTSLRADPWFAEPAEWATRHLLAEPRWGWETAGEALSWSRRATALHGGSARVWSNYGLVNARIVEDLGGWPDAIAGARKGYRRATELEPHLPWSWLRWAQLERMLGDSSRALELAQRAVREEPHFVRGWLFISRVELDLGRSQAARDALERARDAARLGAGRRLSAYERDLLEAPPGHVRELEGVLGEGPVAAPRDGNP